MCGIFSVLNYYEDDYNKIEEYFQKGKGRGPEYSVLQKIGVDVFLGFHRLAINGLNDISNQPIHMDNVTLICNGEIYNYKELYKMLGIEPQTGSDCEVIIHLYKKFGIEYTLQVLDGVFAFVLFDDHHHEIEPEIIVARDPYGVRPLYMFNEKKTFGFASEMKMLKFTEKGIIRHFEPGTYSVFQKSFKILSKWENKKQNIKYHKMAFSRLLMDGETRNPYTILDGIRNHLISAVFKRCSTTERPIACLLSGGLDSSLVTALVCLYHRKNGLPPVETYSIGLADSEDLKCARTVAKHLRTRHTEIILTEQEFIDAIPEVINVIESFDTTTVRASIGNYLLGKYISKNSKAKVIFNGDGSDELTGGYLYMKKSPNAIEFDNECRRLLTEIHMFDVLRSDKSISSHGLEPRTPFLDREFTQYFLSLPAEIRFNPFVLFKDKTIYQFPNIKQKCSIEKFLIRASFSPIFIKHFTDNSIFDLDCHEIINLLPDIILWRTKEAFSDGVSGVNRSLYQIIQEHLEKKYTFNMNTVQDLTPQPKTKEQIYYRELFEKDYKNAEIIPHFWMPRFVEAVDPSARTLSIY
jgi:asparagine synthase (glutamine-hydrolysing)